MIKRRAALPRAIVCSLNVGALARVDITFTMRNNVVRTGRGDPRPLQSRTGPLEALCHKA
jgi:hypothetical protein